MLSQEPSELIRVSVGRAQKAPNAGQRALG
jgi:hypothetical protein